MIVERRIYLKNMAWQEGLSLMMEKLVERCVPKNKIVDVCSSLHRVTGNIVRAKKSSPHLSR